MNKPWLRWLLWVQCGLLLVLLGSMLANKFALLEFKLAFMTFYRVLQVVLVVTAVGFIGLLFVWWKKYQDSIRPALVTVLLGLAPVLVVLAMVGQGLKVPAIHNITTDLENPPIFVQAYKNRDDSLNSLDIPDQGVREQQREYYPDLSSLTLQQAPDQVFKNVLAACEALGFEVTDVDLATGRIEAVEETLFFGFKDDLVIRVVALEAGSKVDVRSVSRVGRSDLGANAKRIGRLLDAIQASSR